MSDSFIIIPCMGLLLGFYIYWSTHAKAAKIAKVILNIMAIKP